MGGVVTPPPPPNPSLPLRKLARPGSDSFVSVIFFLFFWLFFGGLSLGRREGGRVTPGPPTKPKLIGGILRFRVGRGGVPDLETIFLALVSGL